MEEGKFTIRNLLIDCLMTLAYCLSVVMTLWCKGSFSSSVLNGPRGLRGPRFLGSGFYNMPSAIFSQR